MTQLNYISWVKVLCLFDPTIPPNLILFRTVNLVVAVFFFFVFFFDGLSKSCSNADSKIETLSKDSNLWL